MYNELTLQPYSYTNVNDIFFRNRVTFSYTEDVIVKEHVSIKRKLIPTSLNLAKELADSSFDALNLAFKEK